MNAVIDTLLREAVDRGDVPGVVAMARDGDRTLYEGAAGLRQAGGPAAMTLDSIFWIASLTKAVTSVAAMQLVEQGRVGLDQPLGADRAEAGRTSRYWRGSATMASRSCGRRAAR